jgi:hypothetical protein
MLYIYWRFFPVRRFGAIFFAALQLAQNIWRNGNELSSMGYTWA